MAKAATKNSTTQIAGHLKGVLADTYTLMIKTHGYHWNVTGPLFPQLHKLFEDQYNALFSAADEIAERIRALDVFALGSMTAFLETTVVKEAGAQPPTAAAMVKDLMKTHEQVRARIAEACDLAGELGDKSSEDIMIKRLDEHDKIIWMLRAQAG
jgi:starvation-inducible DNA-binding protein